MALILAPSLGAHPTFDKSIAVAPFHFGALSPLPLPSLSPHSVLKQCCTDQPANKATIKEGVVIVGKKELPPLVTHPLRAFHFIPF